MSRRRWYQSMLPSVAVSVGNGGRSHVLSRAGDPVAPTRVRAGGFYKIVMALSLLVNLLLAACLWNYTTIETAIAKAQTAVGFAE